LDDPTEDPERLALPVRDPLALLLLTDVPERCPAPVSAALAAL
jgi:hypothetical protein